MSLRFPRGRYGAILADPPWLWRAWSAKGEDRSPDYSRMDLDAIKRLPVGKIAADDCVLFLWCIDSMLPPAFDAISAWDAWGDEVNLFAARR